MLEQSSDAVMALTEGSVESLGEAGGPGRIRRWDLHLASEIIYGLGLFLKSEGRFR